MIRWTCTFCVSFDGPDSIGVTGQFGDGHLGYLKQTA